MTKTLPPRPHLDHLRRQAKTLLATYQAGDASAIATFRQFLPEAKQLSAAKIKQAQYRLADAQSAIARQAGFASWPALSRHVEQLRSLEGAWAFVSLEVEGNTMPAAGLSSSRLLIDGDRFRTESPEAIYEGIFTIDVEAEPQRIDIEFIEGPEAGNWNYGIYRLDGDQLEICLDLNGKPAPTAFATAPRSGTAYEILKRASAVRPTSVTGGKRPPAGAPTAPSEAAIPAEFEYRDSELLRRLQGEWVAAKLIREGMEFPEMMLATGRRSAKGNEIEIYFGGQKVIHARVQIDETLAPIQVNYFNLHSLAKGTIQYGIMEWQGEVACFSMAAPGAPRPADFTSAPGDGRTVSHWRRKG